MHRRTLAALFASSVAASVSSAAHAAFVVYDDFNDRTTLNPTGDTKWAVVSGSNAPEAGGGTATFNKNDFIRSTTQFAVGSTPTTVRYVFSSITQNAVVFGIDSAAPATGGASGDALFARDDSGKPVYTRPNTTTPSTAQGSYSSSLQFVPSTVDFIFGTDTLSVVQTPTGGGSPVTLYSGATPASFDEAQLMEIGAYDNVGGSGKLVLDEVLVQVPEPASLSLLGLAMGGMLTRRSRR